MMSIYCGRCCDLELPVNITSYTSPEHKLLLSSSSCTLYTTLILVCMVLLLKLVSPSLLITATLQYRPFTFGSPIRDKVWGCTTNQHLTGMHFQNDDEMPGSSESTAERGLREEMLRHFIPVNDNCTGLSCLQATF